MTIASIFIRRPRLAFVVSTVITIAGLLAMAVLPVAQFPDIVPPQVRVTASYPGASAQAVEEAVAQVIEAQVNGVEKMIYMKSTSGSDGSYALIVSFEVGSNPDLNTVNVTNRVNQALAQLPMLEPMRQTCFAPCARSQSTTRSRSACSPLPRRSARVPEESPCPRKSAVAKAQPRSAQAQARAVDFSPQRREPRPCTDRTTFFGALRIPSVERTIWPPWG